MIKVSVVIPNYNGYELLKVCLLSLEAQTQKSTEIIVVDNGSSDDSVKFIKGNFPQIKVIRFNKNFGFSRAVNTGIKKSQGKYILLLNNDTELDRGCIKNLVDAVKKHKDAGFVSAKILQFDDRTRIDNAGDYMDLSGHLLTRGFGENKKLYNKGEYIFLGTGSGTLFKREVFERIGYFDEEFFFYMEDADLCFRAQLAGFKGRFEPKALIYHKRMSSSRKYIRNYEALVFRNMTMMVIKNFPKKLLLHNYNWFKIILVHINTLRYLLSKRLFLDVLKAEVHLVLHIMDLLKKRKKIQDLKVVSDDYIISQVRNKKIRVGKLQF